MKNTYCVILKGKSKTLSNKGRSETGPCKSAEIQTLRQPLALGAVKQE